MPFTFIITEKKKVLALYSQVSWIQHNTNPLAFWANEIPFANISFRASNRLWGRLLGRHWVLASLTPILYRDLLKEKRESNLTKYSAISVPLRTMDIQNETSINSQS